MEGIRDFVNAGVKDQDSFFRNAAFRFWSGVGGKARKGEFETWVRAVIYKCTGQMDFKDAVAEWEKPESFQIVLSELAGAMLGREDKLENGIAWKNVITAESEEDQWNAIEKFMDSNIEWFRNKCVDEWRNTEGTFSYYYRRAQNQLRDNLGDTGWSLYDPKSRYYGPAGLSHPEAIDIQDEQILNAIPLVNEIATTAKRVFFKEPIISHAKWFYEKVDDNRRAVVAIRNFVRWLCYRYGLLSNKVAQVDEAGDPAKSLPYGSKDVNFQKADMMKLARKAIALLGERERKILILRLQGYKGQEIADELGLSGPSHVSYYMGKIGKTMRDIKNESHAMSGAVDEDGEYDYMNSGELEQAFTEYFVTFCAD